MDARQMPGSCRNGLTIHLLSANGTLQPVKAAIAHHPGSLGQGAAWSVQVVRSTERAAMDERRLLLRVKADGTIVGVSTGTPTALFGWEPTRLVGRRLETLVDAFWEYSKGGEAAALGQSRAACLVCPWLRCVHYSAVVACCVCRAIQPGFLLQTINRMFMGVL
jgi:hypothetical protein